MATPKPAGRLRGGSDPGILSTVRRSFARRNVEAALAALLLFVVTPGVLEMVEDVAHYIAHGDTLHDEGHDGHCCSGAFHFCGCHARTVATPVVSSRVTLSATPPRTESTWSTRHAVGGPHDAHLLEISRPPAV